MSGLEALRRKLRNGEGDDLWPLSLADMMTLLCCFFLMLLSMSSLDAKRYAEMAASMNQTLGSPARSPEADDLTVRAAARLAKFQVVTRDLANRLNVLPKGLADLQVQGDHAVVSLRDSLMFGSGSAELSIQAQGVLAGIAQALAGGEFSLIVEGHTDNVPMHSERFASNWELSAVRACAVARSLAANGVSESRLQVLGLADTSPVAPNQDSQGRPLPENQAKNRRVVIRVGPQGGGGDG